MGSQVQHSEVYAWKFIRSGFYNKGNICNYLCTERTIYRQMNKYNLSKIRFINDSDANLDKKCMRYRCRISLLWWATAERIVEEQRVNSPETEIKGQYPPRWRYRGFIKENNENLKGECAM